MDEDNIERKPAACVVRDGLSGGFGDQATSTKTMHPAVLLGGEPVSLVGMQAEVGKPVTTLMAQQAIVVLVEDPVAAVAVIFADLHDQHGGLAS